MSLLSTAKSYFVITQGAGLGDSVRRLPITGNETVLDAIAQVGGLSQLSDGKKIRIVRPSASDPKKATVLPVDWEAHHAPRRDGHQLSDPSPRSRLHRRRPPANRGHNLLAKKTAPIERAMGIISLTTSCVQSIDDTPGGAAAREEAGRKGVSTTTRK